MKYLLLSLSLLLLCVSFLSQIARADAASQPVYEARGEARDIKTGQLLYIEQHRRDGIHHQVDYFLPDGKRIVTNRQNFQYSPYVPTMEQIDLRDNVRSGLVRSSNGWEMYNNNEREVVKHSDPLVASSGFDSFIRQNWAALVRGKKIDFDFAVPQSLLIAPLRLTRIDCKKVAISRGTNDALCIEVTPSSLLFSFFFNPIEVAYARETQRLLAYRGLTNLNDANGDTYEAEIFYSYKTINSATPEKMEP